MSKSDAVYPASNTAGKEYEDRVQEAQDYMSRKCDAAALGGFTYQHFENSKTFMSPGVYLAHPKLPGQLNHLIVCKDALRFSVAKELHVRRAKTCRSCFCDIFCCRCRSKKQNQKNMNMFGPVSTVSVYPFDIQRIETETFDLLKEISCC